ncbi:MAG: hypothetical protein ACREDW_08090 [Aestuariivirgaceae bacterium]
MTESVQVMLRSSFTPYVVGKKFFTPEGEAQRRKGNDRARDDAGLLT